MLHQHSRDKSLSTMINEAIKDDTLVRGLLKLSKFEGLLRDLIGQIVKKKSKMWQKDKETIVHDMKEVAEFFAGNRDWEGMYTDESLSEWF